MEPTGQTLVVDLPIEPVMRVAPHLSLREAAKLLATASADVLVLDTTPVSEITERDLVGAIAFGADPNIPVVDVPHNAPEFVRRDTPLANTLATLLATGRRSLVVVHDGVPVGVVRLPVVVAATYGGATWLGALRIALKI